MITNEKFNDLDLVILCGGLGTRLASIMGSTPKPLAKINGIPFLRLLINYYIEKGFKRIILCCGYQADKIVSEFKPNEKVECIFSIETKPLGTGGAIKNCIHLIKSEKFYVVNGDSFCDVELNDMYLQHNSKRAALTIALTDNIERNDGGSVLMGHNQRIVSFREKKQGEKIDNLLINTGIYLMELNRISLDIIPPFSLESDIFENMSKERKDIYGYYEKNKILVDIGTPERYFKSFELLSQLITIK